MSQRLPVSRDEETEKAMVPHSSTLVWKIPWMEEPGGLQSMGSRLSDFPFIFHFSLSCIGEGNGNPLQCSCLENPRDGGAWWAAVYGVSRSDLAAAADNEEFCPVYGIAKGYKGTLMDLQW